MLKSDIIGLFQLILGEKLHSISAGKLSPFPRENIF